jgi:hypothetical protein
MIIKEQSPCFFTPHPPKGGLKYIRKFKYGRIRQNDVFQSET